MDASSLLYSTPTLDNPSGVNDVFGVGNQALVDSSYNQPITSTTVTQDIATQGIQSAAPDNSGSGDVWGAWLRNLSTAAVTAAVKSSTATQKPSTVITAPQNRPVNQGTLLLIGAAVLAVVLSK